MVNQHRQIRSMLESRLPLDSSFDAFCLDIYPDIYKLFTGQMNREQKTNILLASLQDEVSSIIPTLTRYQLAHNAHNWSVAGNRAWRKVVWIIPGVIAISGIERCWYQTRVSAPSEIHSGADQETRNKKSLDGFAGSIFDPNGTPIVGATVILVGTSCSATTDTSGAFQFNNCADAFTAKLIKPRINIYVSNHVPAVDVDILSPPRRTIVTLGFAKLESGEEIARPVRTAGKDR